MGSVGAAIIERSQSVPYHAEPPQPTTTPSNAQSRISKATHFLRQWS